MSFITIEPVFFCLALSLVWAPFILLVSEKISYDIPSRVNNRIWTVALLLAVAPVILAPIISAYGLSLRPPIAPPNPVTIEYGTTFAEPTANIDLPATRSSTWSVEEVFDAAALLYLYGVALLLSLGLFRAVFFAIGSATAVALEDSKLLADFEEWRIRIGIKNQPRYVISSSIRSVCVDGFLRHKIYLPSNITDSISHDEVVLMVAHEMAHIRRRDTWLFAFCGLVNTVFWFNPVMRKLVHRVSLAAEQSADEIVLKAGASRQKYARCFVQGLKFASRNNDRDSFSQKLLVPSFASADRKSRRERLNAILSGYTQPIEVSAFRRVAMIATALVVGLLAAAQAAVTVTPGTKKALTVSPVSGAVIMAFEQPIATDLTDQRGHRGVDIKANRGTIVRAAGDGRVVAATNRYKGMTGWGKIVVIDHGHGLTTRYAHLDSFAVNKGDDVRAGDTIGQVGSTGQATSPHLHFEVLQEGFPINPAHVVAPPMPRPEVTNGSPEPLPPFAVEPVDTPQPPELAFQRAPGFVRIANNALDGGADKIQNDLAFSFAIDPSFPGDWSEHVDLMIDAMEDSLTDESIRWDDEAIETLRRSGEIAFEDAFQELEGLKDRIAADTSVSEEMLSLLRREFHDENQKMRRELNQQRRAFNAWRTELKRRVDRQQENAERRNEKTRKLLKLQEDALEHAETEIRRQREEIKLQREKLGRSTQ